ncbi:MAG TPA: UDP-glucose/GDP-mannose dehydrogenase family protein [Candidatus Dormibacteraeota bacterium]|nr:UDP-glucose/GDP-mannose dehydrogenase family protein [Candidatus Dormibacteraeota bacterium]
MQISVIGCGYVGLVTGTCLAELGHSVLCFDSDPAKSEMLRDGRLPIYEPHLDGIFLRNRQEGRLRFAAEAAEVARYGEAIFICVGTPPLENGEADLSAIDHVARLIATEARSPKLVVEKSTVPVRTGQELKRALAVYGRNSNVSFRVASNPEFLREGSGVEDFLHPDRIVVGVEDDQTERQLREIYQPVLDGKFRCPVHESPCPPTAAPVFVVTTIASSELIKHASNSFLALKISYANALADLCERLGANVEEVTRAMGLDPRIGPHFLRAGLGFGGFCFPKDVQAFIRLSERAGMDFRLLKEVEAINNRQIDWFVEKIRRALWVIRDKQIALLGLAFKPHTDDIRFSPAVKLAEHLLAEGARVHAYDPKAMDRARAALPGACFAPDPYAAARQADALVIATEWPEFAALDWARIGQSMARPLILDGRNLLDSKAIRSLGLEYESVGRPAGNSNRLTP